MRHDKRELVESEVLRLLERSPAYRSLPPDERSELAEGMTEIGDFLADPTWMIDGAAESGPAAEPIQALREQIAPHAPETAARALEELPPAPSQYGDAAAKGAARFKELTEAVDFPAFVSNLIEGVFTSIVDSSIRQMEAYQELVQSVVQSSNQLAGTISDGEAQDYTMSQSAGMLKAIGAGQSARLEVAEGFEDNDALYEKLGIPPGSDLNDRGVQQAMLRKAKLDLAKQKQQMMATMVLLGINRIIVTNGKINAKVIFDMRSTDTATTHDEDSASSEYESSYEQTKKSSGWGSSTKTTQKSNFQSTVASNSTSDTTQDLETKAKLTGEVTLNFKSETFPLDKMASPDSLSAIQGTAVPRDVPGATAQ